MAAGDRTYLGGGAGGTITTPPEDWKPLGGSVLYDETITTVFHNQTVLVSPLTEDITLDVDNPATRFRVLYLEGTEVTNTMSLAFPDDTFILGNAGDDVTFTKLNDDSWFYINERNNEKGVF